MISVCQHVVLSDDIAGNMSDSVHSVQHRSDTVASKFLAPHSFCSAVVKLTAMQMQALGVSKLIFNFLGLWGKLRLGPSLIFILPFYHRHLPAYMRLKLRL